MHQIPLRLLDADSMANAGEIAVSRVKVQTPSSAHDGVFDVSRMHFRRRRI